MRIAVLGANGFIGKALCARLERDGHTVIRCVRGSTLGNTACEYWARYDTIVNCAGQLSDPSKMLADNLLLCPGLLLDECSLAHFRSTVRIIHLGSSSETGPIEGPRSESTPCNPSNLYEATKLAATHLCLGYAAEYDMDVCVARPFTVYGSGDALRKLLPTLWRAWTEGKPFTCHPGGHDWVHIDDFIEGLVALIHAPRAATKGQVYHFGTGISTPNAEVTALFACAVGGSGPTIVHSQTKLRPYDVMDWRADSSKARAALGWTPKVTLQEGISRFVTEQWFATENGVPGL